jgi:putative transposase
LLERAFRLGNEREGFRLVHYCVLSNHLHLFVDADHKRNLSRGMHGLGIRIARGLNRHWRRKGAVFFGRYHARVIEGTVHKIRRVLRYVLQNARKHGLPIPRGEADPYSSARWFNWFQREGMRRPLRSPPVATPLCIATDVCLVRGLDLADLPGSHF